MDGESVESFPEDYIPAEILEAAQAAIYSTLPEKSKKIYMKAYVDFLQWIEKKGTTSHSEPVLLAYFQELSETVLPSTLWAKYSMLKAVIKVEKNLDIGTYATLGALLKRKNVGHKRKKSSVLTTENVKKFLLEFPDDQYLLMKVVAIFGISGACRRAEFHSLNWEDVQEKSTHLEVILRDTKTHTDRTFTIESPFRETVKKYMQLRPADVKISSFFLNYQKGRCTPQPIGINKFGGIPSRIAALLKLPNPETYTGHCFRRSSSTIYTDAGASMTELKRLGGWNSATVAEGYIQDSMAKKRKAAQTITSAVMESEAKSVPSKKNETGELDGAENKIPEMIGNENEIPNSGNQSSIELKVNCTIQ